MNEAFMKNSGAFFAVRAGGMASATAAGAGNGVEFFGPWIQRDDFRSGKVCLHYDGSLSADETLTVDLTVDTAASDQGSGNTVFHETVTVEITEDQGVYSINLDLGSASLYIRPRCTPTLSAGGGDQMTLAITVVLGGASQFPVE